MRIAAYHCAICFGLTLLTACGGGGSGGGRVESPSQPGTTSPTSFGLLKPVESETELARSLHTGLQGASYTSSPEEILLLDSIGAPTSGVDFGGGEAGTFSETNLQELGVDEADIVKYDGEVLYVVDRGEPDISPIAVQDVAGISAPTAPIIRLLSTDPAVPQAQLLAEIDSGSVEFSVDGLYLTERDDGRQLVSIGQTNSFVYWELFASEYYWRNGRTRVQSWDVTDPTSPTASWALEFDGSLLSSRRIENTLYLVTRYSPTIEGLVSYPQTEEDIAGNRELIEQTPLESLLPDVHRDGVSSELLSASDCLISNAEYTGQILPPGEGSLITVTAIDLTAPDNVHSLCLNTFASGFYASTTAIYVTANSSGDSTLIHKIGLAESGPQYRGSGEVPGYIGTSNPSFLMSEHAGDLRVVSSTWGSRVFPLPVVAPELEENDDFTAEQTSPQEDFGRHRLTVLRESPDGTRLDQVAQLPNADRPQRIGKPEEDIYSARFIEERAYIVTFQVIDPLYVVDLTDPEDPQITGELEIPGFSTLLQPVGENLLLGIGHDVPVDGLNLTQGVKLALFDVGNVSQPVSLAEVIIGKRGSYSPALGNHHSLTLLALEDGFRVALPIDRHAQEMGPTGDIVDPWRSYGWSDSGLYLFDIDPVAGTLSAGGSLIIERSSEQQPYNYLGLGHCRSVLHDDAVFFVNDGSVWAQFWGGDGDFSGQ